MKCQLFYCDKKRDRFCCRRCEHQTRCSNPCLNSPERCGQAVEEATGTAKGMVRPKIDKEE